MFEKSHLDALFDNLERSYGDSAEYDRLLKETHLAVAFIDARRPLCREFDPLVVEMVEKHRPPSGA